MEEFGYPSKFYETFDRYERPVLDARAELMEKLTREYLEQAHFDSKTGKAYDETALPSMLKETGANLPTVTDIQQMIQTFNASRQNADEQIQTGAFEMEIPEETCYVSIDDIGVKYQKEHRKESSKKQGVYVWNAVAVVQSQQDLYTLTGVGMPQVFRSTLAYLLAHGLLCHKNLVFFTDGANNIRCNIAETFSFHPYSIILDWYHLKKRCQECLSMSIRGGKEKLFPLLLLNLLLPCRCSCLDGKICKYMEQPWDEVWVGVQPLR